MTPILRDGRVLGHSPSPAPPRDRAGRAFASPRLAATCAAGVPRAGPGRGHRWAGATRAASRRTSAPRTRGRGAPRPGRRARVPLRPMAPGVEQHVAERVPHLPGSLQDPEVIALAQDWSAPFEHPVHRPREAGGERLHASPERIGSVRLHDGVEVIALDRVMDEAAALPLAAAEGALDLFHDRDVPQRGDVLAHLERDVAGVASGEGIARLVGDGRVGPGLASRPRPPSAPGPAPEREVALLRPTH